MPKSAQERFNDYLKEYTETTDAVNEFINSSVKNYNGSYAYATGALSTILQDAISNLPKAKRSEFRERLYSLAQKHKNEILVKTLKKAA